MNEVPQITAAYPSPPIFYKIFTKENIEQTVEVSEDHMSLLTPPPIPTEPLTIFGSQLDVSKDIHSTTLEALGIEQVFKSMDISSRTSELKKLNHSLLMNFMELLDLLIEEPANCLYKVEHVRLLLINMHHLLNDYRPHQVLFLLIFVEFTLTC